MTQELIDLRNSILEQRYTDALAIVDELEGMSRQAILQNIQAFVKVLLIHLIFNKIEKRLTNSWASSIRNSTSETKKLSLKENKKSYYINQNEWFTYIPDEIEGATRDASVEVLNGVYSPFQLAEMLEKEQIPGGENWKLGKR